MYYIPNQWKTFKPVSSAQNTFFFLTSRPLLTYSWTTCIHRQRLSPITLPHHTHLKNRTTMTKVIWSHTPLQAANSVIYNLLAIPNPLWSFSFPTVLEHISSINLGNYYTSGISSLALQQQALLKFKNDLKPFSVIFAYIKSVVKWDAIFTVK